MAQSKLITSLFKIDAAEAFVRYVETVKPYHSKILDVLIEYIYKEDIRAKVKEKWTTDITQSHGSGSCTFTVIPALTDYATGGSITIEGRHQESFKPGDRFVVAHTGTWSRLHTVGYSENVGDTTVIHLIFNQTMLPGYPPTTVSLSTSFDYHIVGAIVGPAGSGAWIFSGYWPFKFQVGETIMTTGHEGEYGAGVYTITSIEQSGTPLLPTTTLHVAEPVLANVIPPGNVTEPYFQAFGSGTLRQVPLVFTQVTEPTTTVIGAIWLNPVTNTTKRWDGTNWIHNYTSTSHAWFLDHAEPKQLIISKAVSQIEDVNDPEYGTSNSFVVDTTGKFNSYGFTPVSIVSNRFIFSDAFVITAVDPVNNTWTVTGTVNVIPGEVIYVNSSSTAPGIGQYIVASVTHIAGDSIIEVTRRISRLASGDGILAVPTNIDDDPRWVEGTRVAVTSTSLLPTPLSSTATYYFVPAITPYEHGALQTPAVFVLSKVRKPQTHDDYVDITTLGTGLLTITQDEPYVPGTKIQVRDSIAARNNGMYTILSTEELATNLYRIVVQERVRSTTPVGQPHDGVITYDLDSHFYSSLTERPCKAQEQSELHVGSHVREFIEFVFDVAEFDFIRSKLLENEPRTSFLRDLGYDLPSYDGAGWDGDLAIDTDHTRSSLMPPGAMVHNIVPMGFDTQFFDLGGIDEDLATVSTYYGRRVRAIPRITIWDPDYRNRALSFWDNNTSLWDE